MIIASSAVSLRSAQVHLVQATSQLLVRTRPGAGAARGQGTALRQGTALGQGTVLGQGAVLGQGTPPVQSTGGSAAAGAAAGAGTGPTGERGLQPAVQARAARFALLIALIERLTGQRVQVLDPEDVQPQPGPERPAPPGSAPATGGAGSSLLATTTIVEAEATQVQIAGTVTTADGRQVEVGIDLELASRVITQVGLSAQDGDGRAGRDPLALSFGSAPGLTGRTVPVDLDGDGTAENLPLVGPGQAYLMLDRDGNGALTDRTELFGPVRGDGFAELAAYDSDGNGWIDEADPVFDRLRLWAGPDQGLQTLAERGVGAIGLAAVPSRFVLRSGGEPVGELRATGLWIGENGAAGTVHELDVLS